MLIHSIVYIYFREERGRNVSEKEKEIILFFVCLACEGLAPRISSNSAVTLMTFSCCSMRRDILSALSNVYLIRYLFRHQ